MRSFCEACKQTRDVETGVEVWHLGFFDDMARRAREELTFHHMYILQGTEKKKRCTLKMCVCALYYTAENVKKPVYQASFEYKNHGKCTQIKNPLFNQKVADYIRNEWAKKIGLWAATSIHLVKMATGVVADTSNQSAEGVMNREKHMKGHTGKNIEPAEYFRYFGEENSSAAKRLLTEMQNMEETVKRTTKRKEARSKNAQKQQNGEEEEQIVWKSPTSATNPSRSEKGVDMAVHLANNAANARNAGHCLNDKALYRQIRNWLDLHHPDKVKKYGKLMDYPTYTKYLGGYKQKGVKNMTKWNFGQKKLLYLYVDEEHGEHSGGESDEEEQQNRKRASEEIQKNDDSVEDSRKKAPRVETPEVEKDDESVRTNQEMLDGMYESAGIEIDYS